MNLGTVKIPIDFEHDWPRTSISFSISKTVFLYIYTQLRIALYIFNETIASFQVPPPYWFYVGCLETISGCVHMQAMQSRNSGICQVADGISVTDQQISPKINVAVNHWYNHYNSVWTFRSIADIAIDLIILKDQYLNQNGTSTELYACWLWVDKKGSRQPGIEAKIPSKYTRI